MGQIRVYLDVRTEALLKRHVRISGESESKWIADAVRTRLKDEWPPDVLKLFRSWEAGDFPGPDEVRYWSGPDARREKL